MKHLAKARSDEEKKEIFKKWKSLINMSQDALDKWAEDDRRLLASLNRKEAEGQGDIQSGYDSFHRIKRRKGKPFEEWSSADFDNASQENGFNSRMLGGKPGEPVEDSGMSKWEISLRNWGHDPSLKSSPAYSKWREWKDAHEGDKMNKKACTISATPLEGRVILFKNRDRNYDPVLKVMHDLVNGVEVIYFMDMDTGWIEGINEYGISIVNSALMVLDDEQDRPAKKKEEDDPDDEGTENLARILARDSYKDGSHMLEALSCRTVEEAADVLCGTRGIMGHNFITDGVNTICVERTLKGTEEGQNGEVHRRKMRGDKIHVRTNHGVWNPKTGYQFGESRESSLTRRYRAQRILRDVTNIGQVGPKIYEARLRDIEDPFNVSRDSNLYTSSHAVFDPKERKMYLYLFPDCVSFSGYEKRFEGKSKCSFSVFRYGHPKEDGSFETENIRINPSKVASKYLNGRHA